MQRHAPASNINNNIDYNVNNTSNVDTNVESKEKKECIKKKAPQFVPPTLTQVKEFVEEQGLKMKAGVLIKAVVSYCTTGEVASWGEDVDLKPIFMSFRATMQEQHEEDQEQQSKDKRAERNRRYYLRRFKTIKTIKTVDQESERESEGDGKKRTKRKEEEGKGKVKEPNKEKINITIYEKKANEQTELFESEAPHNKATEPRFKKPSVADVKK